MNNNIKRYASENYVSFSIQSFKELDPTVPDWAKASTKPNYTAKEVGADVAGTASSTVSAHNTNTLSHNDIRDLITGLTTRLNALADSDDTTLDQLSEIVAYIKANKTLIDSVTISKVNVADIIDNLTTNVSSKPLSASQGVAIKALIDALQEQLNNKVIPTKISQLENDSNFITASTLDTYATKEYVEQKISSAITTAIGGSY